MHHRRRLRPRIFAMARPLADLSRHRRRDWASTPPKQATKPPRACAYRDLFPFAGLPVFVDRRELQKQLQTVGTTNSKEHGATDVSAAVCRLIRVRRLKARMNPPNSRPVHPWHQSDNKT